MRYFHCFRCLYLQRSSREFVHLCMYVSSCAVRFLIVSFRILFIVVLVVVVVFFVCVLFQFVLIYFHCG